jgi:hypothetical protein
VYRCGLFRWAVADAGRPDFMQWMAFVVLATVIVATGIGALGPL